MRTRIALFDLDGTLIQSTGYCAAYTAALAYFVQKSRMDIPLPGEDIHSFFESFAVTSEWDMIPICLAVILDRAVGKIEHVSEADSIESALNLINCSAAPLISDVDYRSAIRTLSPYFHLKNVPSESLLEARRKFGAEVIFPNLKNEKLLDELFADTRSLSNSPTMLIFQNVVLGHEMFEKTYGIQAPIESIAHLAKFDTPLITVSEVERLKRLRDESQIYYSAYTVRPSLPPAGIQTENPQYSPEAEMGLELIGLQNTPLMGYGKIAYLAEQTGEKADQFVKPAPLQALAAVGAALTGDEWSSLQWAYSVHQFEKNECGIDFLEILPDWLPRLIDLFVFEDSPTGIRAAASCAQTLERLGIEVQFKACGIATNPEKTSALQQAGAEVFADINQALRKAFPK